ncbi:MAG: thiolase family protein [Sphingomonas sp.]
MASPIAGAAMAFDLYCRRYRQDRELLGAIPIAFRKHAGMTDDAVMRAPLDWPDYAAAAPIIDPLRLLDCSPVGDGAVCIVVAAAQGGRRAVPIAAMQGIAAGRESFIFAPHGLGMGQQSGRRLSAAEARAQRVYAMAGAGPEGIDVLGLYDSLSPLPLYALEDFGFCGEGEALEWVQRGRIELGGELPVNTGGGQLSQAQMNGWGQIRELVVQLRHEAGARQVPDARRAMWATPAGDALILERS